MAMDLLGESLEEDLQYIFVSTFHGDSVKEISLQSKGSGFVNWVGGPEFPL